VPLSETGRRQAEALARLLAAESVAAVYSSPLRRAAETAEIIARAHGLPVRLVADLRELDQGELEGLSVEEMRSSYREFWAAWSQDPGGVRMPGGETMAELAERVWGAVSGIVREHGGETVVVVTHGFALLSVVARALDLELAYIRRFRVDCGGVCRLDFGRQPPALLSFNETAHLRLPD
jgi:broad specificity phosphatase PhoE